MDRFRLAALRISHVPVHIAYRRIHFSTVACKGLSPLALFLVLCLHSLRKLLIALITQLTRAIFRFVSIHVLWENLTSAFITSYFFVAFPVFSVKLLTPLFNFVCCLVFSRFSLNNIHFSCDSHGFFNQLLLGVCQIFELDSIVARRLAVHLPHNNLFKVLIKRFSLIWL